jgi:polo-like kinase 1
LVEDKAKKRRYTRGKFLGKGGFARCYELTDQQTNNIYAGKVVSKMLLQKKHQKDKMTQEIQIHRTLSHPHVVKLEGFFEDDDNVYILLELCPRRSLMELHKRRRHVTEPEARYFTHQIVTACQYLHDRRIIHRDLKLGNLFLNDEMQVKIGDFGLATTLDFDGERKKTLCGTPNYIAPEMLDKKGHSYEVDIWAVGCILYTLLVGKPPFETETLKDTYNRIKTNQYSIPSRIGKNAATLISRLLAPDPARRPNVHEILQYPFFTEGFLPNRLPTSCLTMAPKFNQQAVSGGLGDSRFMERVVAANSPQTMATIPEPHAVDHVKQDAASVLMAEKAPDQEDVPADFYLNNLYAQLITLLKTTENSLITNPANNQDVEDPACIPIYWISKWVDYSDKYGLGYQLCDNSVGVLFNDATKFILDAAGEQVQYTDRANTEHYHLVNEYPRELEKKVTLLRHFRSYMNEHLQKTGANFAKRDGDELARLPCLNTWFRTKSAIVMHLSNGTLQINFFHDHAKLVLCPLVQAVTFIHSVNGFHTYKFSAMQERGCPKELAPRLKYAKSMVERMLSRNPGGATTAANVSI